jgi:cytochrome c oxidase subunit III
MSERRAVIDVSHLPNHGFGPKAPEWWGTLGFMLIESSSLGLCYASILYVRKNFETFPPAGTSGPSLLVPAIVTLLFIAALAPSAWLYRAAHRYDVKTVKKASVALLATELVIIVTEAFAFQALNTRWDSNAYGSLLWFTLGFHFLLLLVDFGESAFIAAIFFRGPVELKHFGDAADDVIYWWFISTMWLLTSVFVFLSPYFL